MTAARRPFSALLIGLVLFALAACTGSAPKASGPDGTPLPVTGPSTFSTASLWQADIASGTSVRVGQFGIAALLPGTSPTTMRVTVLDSTSGKPVWTSAPFPVSAQGKPALAWTSRMGHPVVLVSVADGKKVTVRSFDLYGAGSARPAMAEATFTGPKTAPRVIVTDSGVLVTGVADGDKTATYAYRATTGEKTRYGTGPSRGGKPGVPVAAYNDGFLVTFPTGGVAFASASGGWDSAQSGIAPKGTLATKGTLVGQAHGMLVIAWPSTKGSTWVLGVHSQANGRLLAQQPLVGALPKTNSATVAADDSSWLAWGDYVFGLRGQKSQRLDLRGGSPVLIFQDVVYARGATSPFPTPTPTPEPSDSGTPSATPSDSPTPGKTVGSATPTKGTSGGTPTKGTSSGTPTKGTSSGTPTKGTSSGTPTKASDGPSTSPSPTTPFYGFVMVDAGTGTPVGNYPQVVPVGISAVSQGIFVIVDGATTKVVSVASR